MPGPVRPRTDHDAGQTALTYYIQVGGFRNTLFGDGIPDTGRIRVAVRYAD